MRKLPSFWRCIEDRTATASPLARWRLAAGPDYHVLQPFLTSTACSISTVYPCPECGRDLVVVQPGTDFGAEPSEHADCRPIDAIERGEVLDHVLNWSALLRNISATVGVTFTMAPANCGTVTAHGELTHDFHRHPVRLCFAESATEASEQAVRWLIETEGPSIFITGIHRPACAKLLAKTGCAYIALEDVITADDAGVWTLACDLATRVKTSNEVREKAAILAAVDGARDQILDEVIELKGAVTLSLDQTTSLRRESDRRKATIEAMSDSPDTFLAGIRSRIKEPDNLELFMCLMEKTNDKGSQRFLTYEEIGARMHGITRQAVGQRVARFRAAYPEVWDYVASIREPAKEVAFSALSPSDRRKRGIDESYNYEAK